MRQRRSGAWIAIPWAVGTAVAGMALAALGGVDVAVQWYLTLHKPAFQPPAWVFGPAWTAIFALAAWAFIRAWRRGGRADLVLAYAINAVLNATWTGLFFGLRRIDFALAEVVPLWVSVLAMWLVARRRDRLAGWLLLPYLFWVAFAGVLNFAIWRLNGAGS